MPSPSLSQHSCARGAYIVALGPVVGQRAARIGHRHHADIPGTGSGAGRRAGRVQAQVRAQVQAGAERQGRAPPPPPPRNPRWRPASLDCRGDEAPLRRGALACSPHRLAPRQEPAGARWVSRAVCHGKDYVLSCDSFAGSIAAIRSGRTRCDPRSVVLLLVVVLAAVGSAGWAAYAGPRPPAVPTVLAVRGVACQGRPGRRQARRRPSRLAPPSWPIATPPAFARVLVAGEVPPGFAARRRSRHAPRPGPPAAALAGERPQVPNPASAPAEPPPTRCRLARSGRARRTLSAGALPPRAELRPASQPVQGRRRCCRSRPPRALPPTLAERFSSLRRGRLRLSPRRGAAAGAARGRLRLVQVDGGEPGAAGHQTCSLAGTLDDLCAGAAAAHYLVTALAGRRYRPVGAPRSGAGGRLHAPDRGPGAARRAAAGSRREPPACGAAAP